LNIIIPDALFRAPGWWKVGRRVRQSGLLFLSWPRRL